mgnify:CR=1 FL=1|jgi:hypothetical protein
MEFTVNLKEESITWTFQDEDEHNKLLAAVAKLLVATGQFIPKDDTGLLLPESAKPETVTFVPNVLQSIGKEEMFNA